MKKICPICKKENLTSWKYCSADCIDMAKKLAKLNQKQFRLELERELQPPENYKRPPINNLEMVDENGYRMV